MQKSLLTPKRLPALSSRLAAPRRRMVVRVRAASLSAPALAAVRQARAEARRQGLMFAGEQGGVAWPLSVFWSPVESGTQGKAANLALGGRASCWATTKQTPHCVRPPRAACAHYTNSPPHTLQSPEPEHLLLGLLSEQGGAAASLLAAAGVDAATARERLDALQVGAAAASSRLVPHPFLLARLRRLTASGCQAASVPGLPRDSPCRAAPAAPTGDAFKQRRRPQQR